MERCVHRDRMSDNGLRPTGPTKVTLTKPKDNGLDVPDLVGTRNPIRVNVDNDIRPIFMQEVAGEALIMGDEMKQGTFVHRG